MIRVYLFPGHGPFGVLFMRGIPKDGQRDNVFVEGNEKKGFDYLARGERNLCE
jgi:hypothetical protein